MWANPSSKGPPASGVGPLMSNVRAPMLVSFLDDDRTLQPDTSGFNKIGIVTACGHVVYERKRRIIKAPQSVILHLPQRITELPAGLDRPNVDAYFLENHLTFDVFNLGLYYYLKKDAEFFIHPLRLPKHDEIGALEHAKRCERLLAEAKTGDLLHTFTPTSFMSRTIARIDNGPWSHAAIISDTGTVLEAVPGGVREISLTHYLTQPYRVGLYRVRGGIPDHGRAMAWARSEVGKPYAYKEAAIAGLKKVLRIENRKSTPNDIGSAYGVILVCRV